jgi:transposase
MRGEEWRQRAIMMVMDPDERVPKEHPLRRVKELADAALVQLSSLFDEMYSANGRPSIPPERLLKASLLMALYMVRSERMFCEQIDYNLLFRWFLDMDLAEASFDHSTFSRNRARLLEHGVARQFFTQVVEHARAMRLLSDEHFTVDGTLVEAWASLKSFRPKGEQPGDRTPPDDPGNPSVDFHGERRHNATHQSTTDPEARLAKKGAGKEARLCYTESLLMENRNGIMIDLRVGQASGRAECEQGLAMLQAVRGPRRIRVAGDKGYDTAAFVASCRALNVTHTWRRMSGGRVVRRSTIAPPVGRDTRSANECASGSRRSSAGSRRSATSVALAIEASSGPVSPPTWSAPPTTCDGSQSSVPADESSRQRAAPATANPVTTRLATSILTSHRRQTKLSS